MSSNKTCAADFVVVRVSRHSLNKIKQLPVAESELYEYLSEWLACPNVLEAVYLASPSLVQRLGLWHTKPHSKSGRKVTKALLKYLIRMSSRPTPFGLFAGVTLGRWDIGTELTPDKLQKDERKTRLDMFYLGTIQQQWPMSEEGQRSIIYSPNKTSYKVGDCLHYIESYHSSSKLSYRLSSVELDEALQNALALAKDGKKKSEIVSLFCKKYIDVEEFDVVNYIEQLIQEQVLVADLKMPIIGDSAAHALVQSLKSAGNLHDASEMEIVLDKLAEFDSDKNASPIDYENIYKQLQYLPYSVSENKLFQTDVWRAMRKANLEVELARQLESVLLALQASCKKSDTPFKSFIEKFQTRFEGQFIPLMKLLDDEVGISFSNESGYEMPLLEDIDFSGSSRENNEAGKEALEQNLLKAWKNSYETIIQLKTDELLSGYDSEILWQQMPASFAVNVSAYRDDSGQLIIHYHNCHGPSGANWLGRFCHLNGELLEQVRDYLAAEASLSPDVIFAEIAHMPDGRPGNVVSRPALRDYEIVFMADSCLPEEQQINMQDLYVFLEHGQVKLWSSKLNKQIIPRLTCAHNFSARSLGVYRFLCMLQHQQAQLPYFKMPTALQQLECIPRVQLDNVILQEAQWRVERKMFEALVVDNRWCVEAWHALEKRYKLTRYVCYATGDNVLTIDLYNPAMLEMLLDETNSQHYFMLKECLQMQYQSMVMSDEGEFSHEIIVPMLNTRSVPFVTVNPQPEKQLDISIQRYYAPGSECLSLKIYAEHSIAELVLVQTLGPFLQAYKQQGLLKKWFFIRYGDPDWHLRLRVFGEPAVLCGTILPQLQQKLSPLLYSQRINKIEACTYQREVERYGGNSAIELAEQVFQTDSVFVLESLSLVRRYDESVRWRMALLGVNDILTAFEYDSMQKLKLISELRHSFGQEFYEDTQLRNQLGKKYRESQAQIKADFQISTVQTNEPLSQSMAIARTKFLFQLQPIAQKILVLHRQGQLNCSIDTLLHSLLHMFNNRIFKARGREQEFVVYDFLRRFYLSWQAQHTVEEVQQTTSRYQ